IDGIYTAVDVPGYGYAKRSMNETIAFGKMMEDYFSRTDKIKLVIMIVDSKIGLTNDDQDMKEFIEDRKLDYLIVANKIDKLSNNQLMNNKHKLFKDYDNIMYVSAATKTNIDKLKEYILESVK
ncbi:MAG: 50S ribosome-binding GTPase, partial [Erysipelotrichaceae bacterium]|nr:50S ribosome-binding GTPase [Erysipelotrichaceae bacterium]